MPVGGVRRMTKGGSLFGSQLRKAVAAAEGCDSSDRFGYRLASAEVQVIRMQGGERDERPCRRGNDSVVARTAIEDVQPAAADQHIVTPTATERIVAWAAYQDVVAISAIGRQQHRRPKSRRRNHVVAVESIDDNAIGCLEV